MSQFVPIRFLCPNTAGMQPFSHLRTVIEMCGITSTLHNQIDGLEEGGRVPWSPDLTPLDYLLWGTMKSMLYGTPVTSEENPIARVQGEIENLTRQSHLLGHVCEAQHRRCRRLCNDVGGTQFVM